MPTDIPGAVISVLPPNSAMTKTNTIPSIDEYLRERLMPVEGAIPHIAGVEMFGNSIPVGPLAGIFSSTSIFNSFTTLMHEFSRRNGCPKSSSNRLLQEILYAIRSTIRCSG
jgi:hypothetical protein